MARLLLILWFALAPAQAIVWHSDKKAPPQSKPEGAMRNIARVHFTKARVFGGCGIQLNDRWILIAKHEVNIFKAGSLQVRIGEKRIAVKRIVRHPDEKVDLALLELAEAMPPPEKITLFTGKPKKGARLWLGGFGKSGPAGKAGLPGKFAAGFNRLEAVKNDRGKIVFDKAVADEVLPTRFDSGSPVFIKVGKKWQLFGITVTASNSKNPNYGDRSHHQLIPPVRKWLEKAMR